MKINTLLLVSASMGFTGRGTMGYFAINALFGSHRFSSQVIVVRSLSSVIAFSPGGICKHKHLWAD
jgi:ABC-type methionine transport system permease subunit